MRFCEPHWTGLRSKIAHAGMADLVSKGGAAAMRNFESSVREGTKIENFDPLLVAHNMIWMNALEALGPSIMVDECCPVCDMNQVHEQNCKGPPCRIPLKNGYDAWLDRAVEDTLEMYARLLKEGHPQ